MKVSTQNHIRDALGIIVAATATPLMYADLVKPLGDVSPQIAHAWPFVVAASPIISRLCGTLFRLWNQWYPPSPEVPPQTPATPQP